MTVVIKIGAPGSREHDMIIAGRTVRFREQARLHATVGAMVAAGVVGRVVLR